MFSPFPFHTGYVSDYVTLEKSQSLSNIGCSFDHVPKCSSPKQGSDDPSARSVSAVTHFLFSTDNFASCFSSPAGDFLSKQLYTTSVNHVQGDFHYSGKLRQLKKLGRCDVGVVVPEDKIILFKMTRINLPCRNGFVRIYESTNTKYDNRRLTFCAKRTGQKPRASLLVTSQTAVVTLVIRRLSPDTLVQVHFSAVLPSAAVPSHNAVSATTRAVSPSTKTPMLDSKDPTTAEVGCESVYSSGDDVYLWDIRPAA